MTCYLSGAQQKYEEQFAAAQQRLSPQRTLQGDGSEPLKVATSVGIVHLLRQVLYDPQQGRHCLPTNAWLPAHGGMLITRRLQEWACLLGVDFAFTTAQRLLGWQAGEAQLLCTTELRRLVCRHGLVLREAAEQEVQELLGRPDLAGLTAPLVPATPPRRPAAGPTALQEAVAQALAQEDPAPPEGVSPADWERVLAVRRQEPGPPDLARLARLGPELAPDQILVSADEVLVRQPQKGAFAELRTAKVATRAGYRYVCGSGGLFLQELWLLLQPQSGMAGHDVRDEGLRLVFQRAMPLRLVQPRQAAIHPRAEPAARAANMVLLANVRPVQVPERVLPVERDQQASIAERKVTGHRVSAGLHWRVGAICQTAWQRRHRTCEIHSRIRAARAGRPQTGQAMAGPSAPETGVGDGVVSMVQLSLRYRDGSDVRNHGCALSLRG
jgi:hypothetical protein